MTRQVHSKPMTDPNIRSFAYEHHADGTATVTATQNGLSVTRTGDSMSATAEADAALKTLLAEQWWQDMQAKIAQRKQEYLDTVRRRITTELGPEATELLMPLVEPCDGDDDWCQHDGEVDGLIAGYRTATQRVSL